MTIFAGWNRERGGTEDGEEEKGGGAVLGNNDPRLAREMLPLAKPLPSTLHAEEGCFERARNGQANR